MKFQPRGSYSSSMTLLQNFVSLLKSRCFHQTSGTCMLRIFSDSIIKGQKYSGPLLALASTHFCHNIFSTIRGVKKAMKN